MSVEYLNFLCTKENFTGSSDPSVVEFDAYEDYNVLTKFYDSCPECETFPKDEYFSGDWYENWTDYVIWEDGIIAARAGIWKVKEEMWEVAGVITRPEYRGRGYSTRLVAHCIAKIIEQGRKAVLSTAESNLPMIAAAIKAGFRLQEQV